MAISLEEEVQKLPYVKLPNVGDWLSGHVVDMETRNDYDTQTKSVKLKPDGTPRKVLVLTLLIKEFSPGARICKSPDEMVPEPGDEAQIYVQGATWHWWIEAKINFKLEVGDVVRWKFEGTRPNNNRSYSDFKDRKFAFRKPSQEESGMVLMCEDAHMARKEKKRVSDDEYAGTNADPSRQIDASDKF